MIYFIQAVDGGNIKIGTTITLATRLRNLENACGRALGILGIMDGSHKEEHALHRRFSNLQAFGEWFKPEAELVAFIRENTRPWDGEDANLLRTLTALKGTEELAEWVDRLMEYSGLPNRGVLAKKALRCLAEKHHFEKPMPKR